MKAYELYFYRTEVLEPLQRKLEAEAAEAAEADYRAWKAYEAMTDDEYMQNAAVYDAQVDETSKRAKLLQEQWESVTEAVSAILKLQLELEFLEDSKLV